MVWQALKAFGKLRSVVIFQFIPRDECGELDPAVINGKFPAEWPESPQTRTDRKACVDTCGKTLVGFFGVPKERLLKKGSAGWIQTLRTSGALSA
jgi:hypothetical protein